MPTYLQLKVQLRHVRPAIWRRFLIRPDATFAELHEAIQITCGWENDHLYCFFMAKPWRDPIAGVPDGEDPATPDSRRVVLDKYFGSRGRSRCLYVYDFGDEWRHDVILEEKVTLPEEFVCRLVDGKRAFPPEDCGGLGGYEDCLEVFRGPKPTDSDQLERLEWMGDWDPERFDQEKVARRFDSPRQRRPRKATGR